MKFLGLSLIHHTPDPLTGRLSTTTERFREVVDNAVLLEQLGFDGYGVGERHHRPFISTSPPVVLAHIAALTTEIRLFSTVTLLSILDPVRVAEDYATVDHLSNGRLEVVIGIDVTGRQSFIGTPPQVADAIDEFVQTDAADGVILVPHITPAGLDDFVDRVVPLLQERGSFRADYETTTLRAHLGLPPAGCYGAVRPSDQAATA